MKSKNIIIGLCLIILGILIGLATFDIIDFDLFFPGWWTLFIIVPSLISVLSDEEKTLGLVGLFIGCLLFLASQPFFDFEILWKLFIPVLLVIIGLNLIFKPKTKIVYSKKEKNIIKDEQEINQEEEIIQKEDKKKEYYKEENILNISTIFRNTTTDLSEKVFNNNDIIKVSTIFGDNKIYLPSNVNVKIVSGIFFGNIYNNKIEKDENKITVTLDCGVLFGNIEIKEK